MIYLYLSQINEKFTRNIGNSFLTQKRCKASVDQCSWVLFFYLLSMVLFTGFFFCPWQVPYYHYIWKNCYATYFAVLHLAFFLSSFLSFIFFEKLNVETSSVTAWWDGRRDRVVLTRWAVGHAPLIIALKANFCTWFVSFVSYLLFKFYYFSGFFYFNSFYDSLLSLFEKQSYAYVQTREF